MEMIRHLCVEFKIGPPDVKELPNTFGLESDMLTKLLQEPGWYRNIVKEKETGREPP